MEVLVPHTPAAGGFVFEPRKLSRSPKQFGKTSLPLDPAEGVDQGDPRFRAASLQHVVANLVREMLLGRDSNLNEFVAKQPNTTSSLGYDRLVRIQRGETMMQLADLLYWSSIFPAIAAALADYPFGTPGPEHERPTD
jgi:hypothetical protein